MFDSVHLIVRDREAAFDFYRRVGLDIGAPSGGPVRAKDANLVFEDLALCRHYDPNWDERSTATLQFELASHEAVDQTYADLTSAGYTGHLEPFDAFWGARYAIVDDPDGNVVGLQSPVDPSMQSEYRGPR